VGWSHHLRARGASSFLIFLFEGATMSSIDDMPRVMGDDGQFHAPGEAVDLSGTPPEAWVAVTFFWILGLTVFYQFFTRYVLNDSASWTEEIARYLLIATVFTGATIGVIKNNHIQVDFFYRYMPTGLARLMALLVDLLRVAFFAAAAVFTVMLMLRLGGTTRMTMVDLPMNWVYSVVMVSFAAMAIRSVQVAWIHHRRGFSVLERPECTMDDR